MILCDHIENDNITLNKFEQYEEVSYGNCKIINNDNTELYRKINRDVDLENPADVVKEMVEFIKFIKSIPV